MLWAVYKGILFFLLNMDCPPLEWMTVDKGAHEPSPGVENMVNAFRSSE